MEWDTALMAGGPGFDLLGACHDKRARTRVAA
jgi:hypothetical protein